MERRDFVKTVAIGGAVAVVTPLSGFTFPASSAATSGVPLAAPLIHVRHGLYNPTLLSQLTKPIAGDWVYSYCSDVFARDGVEAQHGDHNPVSISMFVGTDDQKELLHFIIEDNKCNILNDNVLNSIYITPNSPTTVAQEGLYHAQIFHFEGGQPTIDLGEGEHFISLISGEMNLDNHTLDSERALFIEKGIKLPLNVAQESLFLVVSRRNQ